ncbi:hypothetical protein AB835_03810 [Candidatus Endobugula sertula]|uniref:eCIS core domain-containing protein n=1 Tax=Candidatus Endobugula sertula TaxID=62101 RepID=A0A1D2QSA0_9GAMM|nr:hypothetical protein AB835_03810 [Candidatus Endobugula sertula]
MYDYAKSEHLKKSRRKDIRVQERRFGTSAVERVEGLPHDLQQGIRQGTRLDLSAVKVHYNSPKPRTIGAEAYAHGENIHLGEGNEQHLKHELGHVVQQKQGQVKAQHTLRNGIGINTDSRLEKEADEIGDAAVNTSLITNHSMWANGEKDKEQVSSKKTWGTASLPHSSEGCIQAKYNNSTGQLRNADSESEEFNADLEVFKNTMEGKASDIKMAELTRKLENLAKDETKYNWNQIVTILNELLEKGKDEDEKKEEVKTNNNSNKKSKLKKMAYLADAMILNEIENKESGKKVVPEKLSETEGDLYVKNKDALDKILKEIKKGNLICISDPHQNKEPFIYASILCKMASAGTLMLEGPQILNEWNESEFAKKHKEWNEKAFQNTFQADMAQGAKKLGWKIVSVDALPEDGAARKTVQGWDFGTKERQIYIKDEINKVLASTQNAKILVIGTAHIIGSRPYDISMDEMTGHQKKLKLKNGKGRSRIWVVDVKTKYKKPKMTKKQKDEKDRRAKLERTRSIRQATLFLKGDATFTLTEIYKEFSSTLTMEEIIQLSEQIKKRIQGSRKEKSKK